MRRLAKHLFESRRTVSAVLLAHLLAVLLLAASPGLHRWLHPDGDGPDDDCAVILFLHSGPGTTPAQAVAPAWMSLAVAEPASFFSWTVFVPSVFAGNRVFEHGPPPLG